MLNIENLASDILSATKKITDVFCPAAQFSHEERTQLRTLFMQHIGAYLQDDSVCGHHTSLNILLGCLEDFSERNDLTQNKQAERKMTASELVYEFSKTKQFQSVRSQLTLVDKEGWDQRKSVSNDDIIRILTIYTQAYSLNPNNWLDTFNYGDYQVIKHSSSRSTMQNHKYLSALTVQIANSFVKQSPPSLLNTVDECEQTVLMLIQSAVTERNSLNNALTQTFEPTEKPEEPTQENSIHIPYSAKSIEEHNDVQADTVSVSVESDPPEQDTGEESSKPKLKKTL